MEAVIPQGSRGELSIVLFQLAYKFITIERGSHLSQSPLMDLKNFRHFIFIYNLSNNQAEDRTRWFHSSADAHNWLPSSVSNVYHQWKV